MATYTTKPRQPRPSSRGIDSRTPEQREQHRKEQARLIAIRAVQPKATNLNQANEMILGLSAEIERLKAGSATPAVAATTTSGAGTGSPQIVSSAPKPVMTATEQREAKLLEIKAAMIEERDPLALHELYEQYQRTAYPWRYKDKD
jgi:hypothetical protein